MPVMCKCKIFGADDFWQNATRELGLCMQNKAALPLQQVWREAHKCTLGFAGSRKLGHKVSSEPFFDTVRIDVGDADKVMQAALKASVNLRQLDSSSVSIALDETTMVEDVDTLLSVLNGGSKPDFDALSLADQV